MLLEFPLKCGKYCMLLLWFWSLGCLAILEPKSTHKLSVHSFSMSNSAKQAIVMFKMLNTKLQKHFDAQVSSFKSFLGMQCSFISIQEFWTKSHIVFQLTSFVAIPTRRSIFLTLNYLPWFHARNNVYNFLVIFLQFSSTPHCQGQLSIS